MIDQDQIAETVRLIRAQVGGVFALSDERCAALVKSLTDLAYVRGQHAGVKEGREIAFPNGVVSSR